MELIKGILLASTLFVVLWSGRGWLPSENQIKDISSVVTLSGEVEAKQNNIVFVDTPQGTRQILVTDNTQIYQNSQPVDENAINKGDRIVLVNQGNASVLQVTSNNPADRLQSANWGRWLRFGVILLVVAVVLLALVKLLNSRRNGSEENKEEVLQKYHTTGLEAAALGVFNSIEKVLQRISFGLQRFFQGGKTTAQT